VCLKPKKSIKKAHSYGLFTLIIFQKIGDVITNQLLYQLSYTSTESLAAVGVEICLPLIICELAC
jgi:hypothetical protein